MKNGPSPRARKLADRVKVITAELLERRVKDPRLGFVTVTDTRMTNDLQHATVFYTVLDGDESETAAALESASGMIRSELGKQLDVRLTPSIEFIRDGVQENVSAIDKLLQEAKQRDAEVARLAQEAAPAGESDPYKEQGE